MSLVAGTNGEGYLHALSKTFREFSDKKRPTKSALSTARKRTSYKFFKDGFTRLVRAREKGRATFHGLYVYAVDGQQLILPRTKDIVAHKFTGRATGKYKESYYPRGYLTHAYDVLNRVSKHFTFNPTLNEQADARNMLGRFEKNSLTIYDRLYFSVKMVAAHLSHGSFFLMRCRSNCHATVRKLLASKKKVMTGEVDGKRIHFIKCWLPKTKEWAVYATNLPRRLISQKMIFSLYRLRWEAETAFKELTAITKVEQWHTKTYNGILQELYALLWLINVTRGVMHICGDLPQNHERRTYKKANFKLLFNTVADRIHEIWYGFRKFIEHLKGLVKDSTEKRKRCSRSYPRHLRKPASPYPYNNTEWTWDKGYDLK